MTDSAKTPRAPELIWDGDLFGRRADAELLIEYIESIGGRVPIREDSRGYTISVDADYGIGKSYFLRRLAEHLSINHPVAFVDAWADDLADEPLTAITATLKKAIAPLTQKEPALDAKWKAVASKSGEVAKIVAKGLLKKGLGLIITSAAVEAADAVLSELPESSSERISESINDAGKDAASEAVESLVKKPASELMAERINNFEAGQRAIKELKESLSDLIGQLPINGNDVPIVVVIDELDRCRPTYAVKLLEETKHLFDVPGIVFILGMHSDQLSRSVAGAYGPDFDGVGYLRRFINRQYSLRVPNMEPLVKHLIQQNQIPEDKLGFPRIAVDDHRSTVRTPEEVISKYMEMYGLTARDAFSLIDLIQTSAAVTGGHVLFMPYLLPLLAGKVKGKKRGEPADIVNLPTWNFMLHDWSSNTPSKVGPEALFKEMKIRASWSSRQLMNSTNSGDRYSELAQSAMGGVDVRVAPLALLSAYTSLVEAVSRFSNPNLQDSEPR